MQFVREFAKLGLIRSVGGVLSLALARELTPVITSIILAGRVGSAFAAELGTMQVSEQTDSLKASPGGGREGEARPGGGTSPAAPLLCRSKPSTPHVLHY